MCSRPQFTDLTYMGGTGPCGPMRIIFGSVIQSWHASLNIKFGVNRTFHMPRPQFTDLTYMGGTRSCGPIQPIFNTNQSMDNRSLCANFQVCSSLFSDAIVFTTDGRTDGRTDGQTDIAQMSQNFALIKCLQGTQDPRSLYLGVTNVLTKLIYPL